MYDCHHIVAYGQAYLSNIALTLCGNLSCVHCVCAIHVCIFCENLSQLCKLFHEDNPQEKSQRLFHGHWGLFTNIFIKICLHVNVAVSDNRTRSHMSHSVDRSLWGSIIRPSAHSTSQIHGTSICLLVGTISVTYDMTPRQDSLNIFKPQCYFLQKFWILISCDPTINVMFPTQ